MNDKDAVNALKQRVYDANMRLPSLGLVLFTWGNVSEIDRYRGIIAIKPSGVEYEKLTPGDIVIVDLDGAVIDGALKPSSDTPTHTELYRRFPTIGGITHTHSKYATVFAQSRREIPPLGTTHADYFHGPVPCTRPLTDSEILGEYEKNTGIVIADSHPDPDGVPAVLVANHGPFTWGKNAAESVYNAAVLEYIAEMAILGGENGAVVSRTLLDKHYFRKHGDGAYYGQG